MSADSKSASTAVAIPQLEKGSFLETLLSIAKTPAERERAFAIAERRVQDRMLAELSAAIAETSWGNKISPLMRQQMVRYAFEIGADPTRHLYALGGKPYLNAEFYRELVANDPDYIRDVVDFVHHDDRADDEEQQHRRTVRIAYGVPEAALGAAVVTLHFKNDRGPFVGVKWAPSHKDDPVGREFPVLVAETRAWRKAAQKAVSPWFKSHPILQKIEALHELEVKQGEVEREIAARSERPVIDTTGGGPEQMPRNLPPGTVAEGARAADVEREVTTKGEPRLL